MGFAIGTDSIQKFMDLSYDISILYNFRDFSPNDYSFMVHSPKFVIDISLSITTTFKESLHKKLMILLRTFVVTFDILYNIYLVSLFYNLSFSSNVSPHWFFFLTLIYGRSLCTQVSNKASNHCLSLLFKFVLNYILWGVLM